MTVNPAPVSIDDPTVMTGRRATAAATAVMLIAAWPPFLTGVMAVSLRDIGLGLSELGLGVAVFFGTAALCSPIGGRVVGRLGPLASLRIVVIVVAVAFVLLWQAHGVAQVLLALGLAGLANALVQPGCVTLVRSVVPRRRWGVALGVVQSAIPASVVVSAALLPSVTGTLGWEATYLTAAVLTLGVLLLLRGDGPRPAARGADPIGGVAVTETETRAGLMVALLLVIAICGAAAASTVPAFGSTGADAVGLSASRAGLWVAAAGIMCVVVRIGATVLAARLARRGPAGPVLVLAGLFVLGACGFVGVASSGQQGYGPALAVAYGFGWGWTGVVNLLVGLTVSDVARATGWTQAGVFAGSAIGPVAFAAVLTSEDRLAVGWWCCATSVALGAVLLGVLLATVRPAGESIA